MNSFDRCFGLFLGVLSIKHINPTPKKRNTNKKSDKWNVETAMYIFDFIFTHDLAWSTQSWYWGMGPFLEKVLLPISQRHSTNPFPSGISARLTGMSISEVNPPEDGPSSNRKNRSQDFDGNSKPGTRSVPQWPMGLFSGSKYVTLGGRGAFEFRLLYSSTMKGAGRSSAQEASYFGGWKV